MVTSTVRFREQQRFTQSWIWVGVLVGSAGAATSVLPMTTDGLGAGAVVLALVAVGLPVMFLMARLVVEVHDDRIVVRFRPLVTRTVPLDTIVSVEPVRYRPIWDYGGWGIKGWTRRRIAYNVRGNRGVLLGLRDGRTILLGSQHAEELAAAIRAAMHAR